MYDNIGAKIKSLATWVFVVEAIAAIIGGIFAIYEYFEVLIGLLLILLGPVVAYVSTWLLYGFGQLIENSDIIAQEQILKHIEETERKEEENRKEAELKEKYNLNKIKSNIARYSKESEKESNLPDDNDEEEDDDDEYIDINCPYCQAELSYTKAEFRSQKMICPMCDAKISQ